MNQKTSRSKKITIGSVLTHLVLVLFVLSNSIGCGAQDNGKTKSNEAIETKDTSSKETVNRPLVKQPDSIKTDIGTYNQYKYGQKDGVWKEFYRNGQMKNEGSYKFDKKEGIHRTWEDNGILSSEGFYRNGKANGLMKWFHEKGHLAGSGNMKDDIRVGPWTICDIEENGFCIEAYFKNGKRDGVWKINHKNGKLWKKQTFKNNKIIAEKCWDEAGKEIECIPR